MGVAIVKIDGKYEARRFDSEQDAREMCSSQTHINLESYHEASYSLVQETLVKTLDEIAKFDPTKRKAAESKLSEIIESKIRKNQQP